MNRSEISDMADAAALLALKGDGETTPVWPSSVMTADAEGVPDFHQKNTPLIAKVATKVRQVILAEWLTIGAIPAASAFGVALKARAIAARELLSELSGGRPRVLAVSAIGAGGFYRMRFPLSLVEEKGGAALTFATSEVAMEEILAHDVLWVQLVSSARMIDKAKAAKAAGVKVVFEVDDPFWAGAENPEAVKYCTPERVARLWEMVDLADVVVTTTCNMKGRILVEHFRQAPIRVEVAKNCIPARMWSKGRHVPGQILWAGSPSHVRDLEMIAEPLAEVFKRHKGAKLILFGIDPPPKRVIDACQGRLGVAPFIEFEEYPDALARVGAHVAIAPLEDNAWNCGKSGIKLVEYGACGYPVIASPVGEYTEILRDADDGIRAKTSSDWELALEHHLSHSCPAMGCGDRLQKRMLAERGEGQCESQWRKVLESITGRS